MDLYTIAEKINKVTGLNKKIRILESGWKKEYSGDNRRMCGEIKDLYFTPMEDAIQEMYTYYLSIQNHISLWVGKLLGSKTDGKRIILAGRAARHPGRCGEPADK